MGGEQKNEGVESMTLKSRVERQIVYYKGLRQVRAIHVVFSCTRQEGAYKITRGETYKHVMGVAEK